MKATTLKLIGFVSLVLIACNGNSQDNKKTDNKKNMDKTDNVFKTDEEWKKILTPEQYHVLREKGTDYPYSGKYYLHKDKGVYMCAGCGEELFTSEMKFDSDCGWPSFDKEIAGGKVKQIRDTSHGMIRTEIICAKCGSHLGHIFDDGPTITGKRYCVNSTSIDFRKDDKKEEKK